MLQYIEIKMECQGLCKPPLFYVTQNLEKGRPLEACAVKLHETIDADIFILGVALLGIALLMLLMLVCQCPLWRYDVNKELAEKL